MTDQLSLADVKADRPGLVRHDHRDTAKQAAAGVKTGTARYRVLQCLMDNWGGATDEEIADQLGMSPSTVRPRRVELVAAGWAQDGGRTRMSRYGKPMTVWQVTDAGMEAVG